MLKHPLLPIAEILLEPGVALPVEQLYFTAGGEPEDLGTMARFLVRQEDAVSFAVVWIKKEASHRIPCSNDLPVWRSVNPP